MKHSAEIEAEIAAEKVCIGCQEETEKTVILKSGQVVGFCEECLTGDVRDFRTPENRLQMANKRGSVLILSLIVTYTLIALTYATTIMTMVNVRSTNTSITLTEAFHVADGGIDDAIVKLEDTTLGLWNSCDTSYNTSVGGEYTIKCPDSNLRKITSFGDTTSIDNRSVTRVVEVYGERTPPADFYTNVIYAANGLNFQGGAYQVVGNVLTGYTDPISNLDHVVGNVTQDESVAPLPELDWEMLKTIAISQGNYFDDWTVQFREFPKTFWYSEPTDVNDPTTGTPNVVYVESSLTLGARLKIVGGLIIVTGGDVSVSGRTTIDGVLYTTGNFIVNGGGYPLNVSGGIFAANIAEINGNGLLEHSQSYMDAVRSLNPTTTFDVLIWRDLRGDPKTYYDQNGNRCHSSEQGCLITLSDWTLIAYGVSSKAYKFVTYRNPDNEREAIQVFYDTTLSGDQVTGITKHTYFSDGTHTEENASNVYQAAATYTEAGGL